ncbi:MAG: CHAT domain-containing protein [Verrucomicrobiales bacterium]|nr:CHAT domain-containing protein [Verrucomicrobiales bacterium]
MNRARLFLLFLSLSILPPLSAQDDLAAQMEKAIATLKGAGGDPESLSMMYNACAEGYIQRGDFKTALERSRASLALCREHGLDSMSSFFTFSKILSQVDDEAATSVMVSELEAPDTAPAYRKGLLKALEMHVGLRGDPKLAVLTSYELWKMQRAEKPGSEEEFWALFNYGNHCLTNKLHDEAVPAITEARELALKIGKPELAANCSRSLAMALLQVGRLEDSVNLTREAIDFIRQGQDQMFLGYELRNLATSLLRVGQLDEAAAALAEALTLSKHDLETGELQSIEAALLLKRAFAAGGEPDYAPVIAKQEAAVASKLKNTAGGEGIAKIGATFDYITLAAYQLAASQLDEAEATLTKAEEGADAWEENSRQAQKQAVFSADQVNLSMAELRSGIYDLRQQIELRRGDVVAALVAAENGRGAAQAALLREKLGLEPEASAVKKLDAAAIREIAKVHRGTIVLYSLVHAFPNGLRMQLTAEENARFPQQLLAWVIPAEGEVQFRSTTLAGPIGDLVTSALVEIRDPANAPAAVDGKTALARLSSLLLDPLREFLPEENASLITFVPQGELFLVPFAALPYGAAGETLLDHHTLTLTPSIELLQLAYEQGRAVADAGEGDVLLVGNPTMPGYKPRPDRSAESLSPLPGAEAEARHLAKILRTEPLIGDAATETAVAARMESARLLHFATHGLLEAESSYNQSLLSSLAFAPGEGEDGFLTAKEISRMKLKAGLAVLSACDTGRGAITGDGVIGLSRGFITAGVPALVVSLWPVSDAATAVMMGHYYESIQSGAGKATALREAMLRTKTQFPEAVMWAPFVHYGLAGK